MKVSVTFALMVVNYSLFAQTLTKEINGHKLLVTSIRTGDTEIFIVDPATGDAFNVSKAPLSEERYPVWMPDGKQVVFTSNRDL